MQAEGKLLSRRGEIRKSGERSCNAWINKKNKVRESESGKVGEMERLQGEEDKEKESS